MPVWLQWLVYGSTAVGAIYVLVTKGMLPLWNFVVAAQRLADAVPTIMAIHEEFKPNSGESMIDKVDALVVGQDNIQRQLENRIFEHDHYHTQLEHFHHKIEQRVDGLES